MKRRNFIIDCAVCSGAMMMHEAFFWLKIKAYPIDNLRSQLCDLLRSNDLGIPLLVIGCYNNNEIKPVIGTPKLHFELCHAILDAKYPSKIRCSGIEKQTCMLQIKNSFCEFSHNKAIRFIEQAYPSELNYKTLSIYCKSGTFYLFRDFSFEISRQEGLYKGKIEKKDNYIAGVRSPNQDIILERIFELKEHSYMKRVRLLIDIKSGDLLSADRP